jgi:hypothetical protein
MGLNEKMCVEFLNFVSGKYEVPTKCQFSFYHLYMTGTVSNPDVPSCELCVCVFLQSLPSQDSNYSLRMGIL